MSRLLAYNRRCYIYIPLSSNCANPSAHDHPENDSIEKREGTINYTVRTKWNSGIKLKERTLTDNIITGGVGEPFKKFHFRPI